MPTISMPFIDYEASFIHVSHPKENGVFRLIDPRWLSKRNAIRCFIILVY